MGLQKEPLRFAGRVAVVTGAGGGEIINYLIKFKESKVCNRVSLNSLPLFSAI